MPPPSANKAAHSGFETQRRHHQKFKTGVSDTQMKDCAGIFNKSDFGLFRIMLQWTHTHMSCLKLRVIAGCLRECRTRTDLFVITPGLVNSHLRICSKTTPISYSVKHYVWNLYSIVYTIESSTSVFTFFEMAFTIFRRNWKDVNAVVFLLFSVENGTPSCSLERVAIEI